MATAAVLADIHQCLEWIGFGDVRHCNAIIDEGGLDRLTDFYDINEMGIRLLAESFSKRSPAANRIIFGMRRIKWLISMMHWAQDHQQCSEDPDLDDIANTDEFKEALLVSAQRASLRKTDAEQVDTISKAVDPGKFKDEKKWPDWEPAFMNYLSTIPGVRGVPLSYVVRENDAPDHEMDFGNDFTACSIACAPLDDASFRADARKVHQLLMNFLVAESAEQWIKDFTPREKFRPYFGWVNVDTVQKTMEQSTQWGVSLPNTFPMKKHLKSRNPALSIPRRHEAVATDTVFSDTPAVNSGVKQAQVFVGRDTLVADAYPMKSVKQFVNTLEDNIRRWGAMDKLLSDSAKTEISNKVMDILRAYHISNWHSEPYHQNQNPAEWRYRTIKSWTNKVMNRSGAPDNCWLLCLIYVCLCLTT